jgi:PAS domain S-box-containing protein
MEIIVVASSENSVQDSFRVLFGDEHMLVPTRTLPQLLNALVEHPVDLVVLDEFLENTDCLTVFQRIRSLAPELTCILLTLQTNSETARQMRAKGVYDVVAKPFDKEALASSVTRAVERAQLLQKLAAARRSLDGKIAQPDSALFATDPAKTHRREMLDSLRKFLRAASDAFAPERLYSLVLDAVVEMFAINKAALLLFNEEAQRMTVKAAVGLDSASLTQFRVAPCLGLVSWLKRHDQILNCDDPDIRINSEQMIPIKKELELLQARICVPLAARGRLIGILTLGKKVTGKRLSEDELEFLYLLSQQIAAIIENARQHRAVFVQKQNFEEILRGVTSGLMATDSDGRLTVFNKAAEQILGLKASEVIGQNVQRTGSIFADIVYRTLREGRSFCRHEVMDPATKSLLGISSSHLTDSGGNPIGAVVLFTDLSTVKRAGAGVADEEAWQRCALCMAQEIKTPLVAIRTFTQLFPESYADEKFRNEFSAIALKEIDKLDSAVERLLRFSHPLEVKPQPGDINTLVAEIIDSVAEAAAKQGVKVKKDFGVSNGVLSFDRTLLSEALIQIINNAIEAMPQGGTLSVSTSLRNNTRPSQNGMPPGASVEIIVSDTGPGITPEEMANLFKPFHTTKVKGMGLGLATSRRIVRGHNGEVMISSDPGKGTVVRVVLPQGTS